MKYILGILRLSMGWLFLWPFLDKLFGLGYATLPEKAWLLGNSPTLGFLKFATKGPFAEFFQSLAGNAYVDWLFMLGLLFVGVTLMLGIMVKLGAYTGALMLILMYAAGFIWPEHNPFLDEHLIYAVVMLLLVFSRPTGWFSLGGWWAQRGLAKKYAILR